LLTVPRFTEANREPVDALVSAWRESCLIRDGSLLHEAEPIWSTSNFKTLMDEFVSKELIDDRTFEEKLTDQMTGLPKPAVRLMAEVIAMYLAFASPGTVGAERKRELIRIPLNLIGDPLPEDNVVFKGMGGGIGGPGQGFNSYRPNLISYVIRFGEQLKSEDETRRRDLVGDGADAWQFKSWLDEHVREREGGGRTMRNVLLHLLFPDDIERIAVDEDKSQIVNALHGLVEGLDPQEADIDRALQQIRARIVELMPHGQRRIGGNVDFYYTPLRESWDPDLATEGRRTARGLSHLQALEYKKQVVLYGPPGTGKTHEAKALAEQLLRRQALRRWGPVHYLQNEERVLELISEQIERRQLHPAYSYEDFIGGLRLVEGATQPTKGHLLQLVDRINGARGQSPDPKPLPWVLILDEINRADLSRLLGEVFSALDDRDAAIALSAPGAEDWGAFRLPPDLFLIGTMNLIDQSVEQLDFALRRRFFWLLSDYREEIIVPVVEERWRALDLTARPWLTRHGWEHVAPEIDRLATRASVLNDAIGNSATLGPQYQLGHTYFFEACGLIADWPGLQPKMSWRGNYLWSSKGQPQPPLRNLWEFSLEPLLDEYLAGVPEQHRARELKTLRTLFLAPVEK
jgi:5-methylcytosine-specific restriction protein B